MRMRSVRREIDLVVRLGILLVAVSLYVCSPAPVTGSPSDAVVIPVPVPVSTPQSSALRPAVPTKLHLPPACSAAKGDDASACLLVDASRPGAFRVVIGVPFSEPRDAGIVAAEAVGADREEHSFCCVLPQVSVGAPDPNQPDRYLGGLYVILIVCQVDVFPSDCPDQDYVPGHLEPVPAHLPEDDHL